ncbi:MAG: hypothetical protein ACRD01_14690 [Terriglobales bacterium]
MARAPRRDPAPFVSAGPLGGKGIGDEAHLGFYVQLGKIAVRNCLDNEHGQLAGGEGESVIPCHQTQRLRDLWGAFCGKQVKADPAPAGLQVAKKLVRFLENFAADNVARTPPLFDGIRAVKLFLPRTIRGIWPFLGGPPHIIPACLWLPGCFPHINPRLRDAGIFSWEIIGLREKQMAKHRLTREQTMAGLRKALRSKNTPWWLRPSMRDYLRRLERGAPLKSKR